MSVKVKDKYVGRHYGTDVEVVGLSEIRGVRYVAFEDPASVHWSSEERFLKDYKVVTSYKPGDILEFSDKVRPGSKVRVLVLDGERGLRMTEWGTSAGPSDGHLEWYLREIDDNPRVLRNYAYLLNGAFGGQS